MAMLMGTTIGTHGSGRKPGGTATTLQDMLQLRWIHCIALALITCAPENVCLQEPDT